jgi:hypothetical protein
VECRCAVEAQYGSHAGIAGFPQQGRWPGSLPSIPVEK